VRRVQIGALGEIHQRANDIPISSPIIRNAQAARRGGSRVFTFHDFGATMSGVLGRDLPPHTPRSRRYTCPATAAATTTRDGTLASHDPADGKHATVAGIRAVPSANRCEFGTERRAIADGERRLSSDRDLVIGVYRA